MHVCPKHIHLTPLKDDIFPIIFSDESEQIKYVIGLQFVYKMFSRKK
jgi:hypothetical protein